MAGANPYTERINNGARFSGTLVNLGTKALREEFSEQINNSVHTDLQSALNSVNSLITDYYRGRNRRPKILNKPQYDLLYPGGGAVPNSGEFDISLLTFMLQNIAGTILGRNDVFKHTGPHHQMLTDLIDLRKLRNTIYGHVSSTAMTETEFQNNFSDLRNILLRFGIPHRDIDNWEKKTLSPDEVKLLENKIEKLCENDITFKDDLTISLQKVIPTLLKSDIQCVRDIEQRINTLESSMSESIGSILSGLSSNICKEICKHLRTGVQERQLENIENSLTSVVQGQSEIVEVVKDSQQELKKTAEMQEKVVEAVKRIQEDFDEHVIKKQKTEEDQEPTLQDLKEHLVNVYNQEKYRKIESLPGECFQLDVSESAQLMPVDFSAEKLEIDKRELVLPVGKRKVNYVHVQVESINAILEAQQNEDSCRLVLVWADPGCGKSVYIKTLVSIFIRDNLLKEYWALFYLPVRDIPDINAPLFEILGCGRLGLGYLPEKFMSCFRKLLSSVTATKVLFLLDGIDEVTIPESSDLFKLIKGDLHPSVKVVISSRPEATTLISLQPLEFNYKVHIKGTTEDGVYKYLENSVGSEDKTATKEEVKALINRCNDQMVEFNLLRIPLYLTIVRYVFDSYYKEHLSFRDYVIPNTVTKLFRVMMHIFLRVWLERMGKKDVAQKLNFAKSPLDKCSTLPNNMKRTLQAIGKMSYVCLLDQIYTFTKQHLDDFYIDVEEASNCGLFCLSSKLQDPTLFFRHKQLSEFMAGMYLGSVKMEDRSFSNRLSNAITGTQKKTLIENFQGIESVMYFTFGLSPQFGIEILNKLQEGHVCVGYTHTYDKMKKNIAYESRLCFESDDPGVYEAMRAVLVQSLPGGKIDYKSPLSIVYSLCKDLTLEQRCTLLRKWYRLEVYRNGDGWGIHKARGEIGRGIQGGEGTGIQGHVGDEGTSMDMEGTGQDMQCVDTLEIVLYDVLFFIFWHNTFSNVKSLTLEESDISDVKKIGSVFPFLQRLDLYVTGETELDDFIDTNTCKNQTHVSDRNTNTLKHVHITGSDVDSPLPRSSIISLIQQTELLSLRLEDVNIITGIVELQGDILWSKLHTLDIQMINQELEHYHGLSSILQCTPTLQSLTWCYSSSSEYTGEMNDFLSEVSGKLRKLKSFRLGQLRSKYSATTYSYIETLCKTILTLPELTTLGLGWRDVKGCEDAWAEDIVKYGQNLNNVQIVYMDGLNDDVDSDESDAVESDADVNDVLDELKSQITQCDPQRHITVELCHWLDWPGIDDSDNDDPDQDLDDTDIHVSVADDSDVNYSAGNDPKGDDSGGRDCDGNNESDSNAWGGKDFDNTE